MNSALGYPEEVLSFAGGAMNPSGMESLKNAITPGGVKRKGYNFSKLFSKGVPQEAINLMQQMLKIVPEERFFAF